MTGICIKLVNETSTIGTVQNKTWNDITKQYDIVSATFSKETAANDLLAQCIALENDTLTNKSNQFTLINLDFSHTDATTIFLPRDEAEASVLYDNGFPTSRAMKSQISWVTDTIVPSFSAASKTQITNIINLI